MSRAFTHLQVSAASANLADGMSLVTFPLLAVSVTSSPLAIGSISAARSLPWLLASVHVGVLIDRKGPDRLLFGSNAIRAALFLVLALLVLFRTSAFLLCLAVLALCVGVLEVAADNSTQTLLPRVVPPRRLPAANARLQLIENAGLNFLGPPVASVLLSLHVVAPLVLISTKYSVAAAATRSLLDRTRWVQPVDGAVSALAGWTHIRRSRALCTLALTTSLMNLASAGAAAVLVLYVERQLHAPAWTYGLLLAAAAAGTTVGAAVAPRALPRTGEARLLRSVLIGLPVPMLVLAGTTDFWVAAAAYAAIGVFEVAWGIVAVSFRQEVVPAHLLGRVNAVYRMMAWGSIPIGGLLAGGLAQVGGLRLTYLALTAVLCVGWLAAVVIRPDVLERERQSLVTAPE